MLKIIFGVVEIKRIVIFILIPLLSLFTVQLCLKNPKTRELFTDIEKREDINYTNTVYENKVKVEITVTEGEVFDSVILYNGIPVKDITSNHTTVEVSCGGIMEIKNNSGVPFFATAVCSERNSDIIVENTFFTRGIKPLCRIIL